MVIKVGNREIMVERCSTDQKLTTLKISRIGTNNKVISLEIVNMDKAETVALLAALKVEAPKE
ncbi:hypothetical protein HN803_04720 [candidate division WWE3 bacterium]|jgi:hypothetical protein|nr:hypothetical protein [Candidatus Scalindua sp.]MBT7350066.1 hypothetical protein [candidate division WWE3 bacterium]